MKLEKLEDEYRRNQNELVFEEISENSLAQQPSTKLPPKPSGGLFSSFFGGSA